VGPGGAGASQHQIDWLQGWRTGAKPKAPEVKKNQKTKVLGVWRTGTHVNGRFTVDVFCCAFNLLGRRSVLDCGSMVSSVGVVSMRDRGLDSCPFVVVAAHSQLVEPDDPT
jgi:ribosome modulation factor